MNNVYARIIDKWVSPELERKLRLGRRREVERRLNDKDRRNNTEEDFRYSQSERRNSGPPRRDPNQDERRRQWYRINSFQSRHLM